MQIAYEIINYGNVKTMCWGAVGCWGMHAGERATILPDSLSTHLCPGGSANSPSPVAPFPPGVVVCAAPVLRCTVPLIHLRRLPSHPEIQNPPLLFRERSGVRLFWDHWRRLGEWGWMGVSGETYRGGAGMARERREERGEREREREEGCWWWKVQFAALAGNAFLSFLFPGFG